MRQLALITFTSCLSEIYQKQFFHKYFLKVLIKLLVIYGIVKNVIISFTQACQYFSHRHFIILLPFSYEIFGASFFYEHLPVIVSANTCLKVTQKNSNNVLKCRKRHINVL